MTNFLEQKCQQRATAMSESEIRNHLAQTSGWREADQAIEKTFAFKDWLETMAFVNALAWMPIRRSRRPSPSRTGSRRWPSSTRWPGCATSKTTIRS